MGRPAKPLEQHQLDGTLRADRHGTDATAVQVAGEPQMPEGFDGEARALWEAVVAPLVSAKVARSIDQAACVAMCEWWARYRRYSDLFDRPATLQLDPLHQARLGGLVVSAWDQFESVAARFGMTPADRMKLRIEGGSKKKGVVARQRT